MAVSAPALREALADVVGRQHFSSDDATLAGMTVDGVVPRWVARPRTEDEVSRLLAIATSERLAVAPRGSGSSQDLGNPPRHLDLVIDLSRLAAVTEYVPEDMVATVEAGVTLGALAARLRPKSQRLVLDPLGGEARTIGGVLATHASGPLRARYGTPRDLLLGVRFVQADGSLTWGGSKVVKSVTGYDVPKLLVGSLGTLGIIVSATLRLHPVPVATGSWLCAFGESAAAGAFLSALLASSIEPERLLLIDARALAAGGWRGACPAVSAASYAVGVLVSIASAEEAVRSQGVALERLACGEGGTAQPWPDAAWPGLAAALHGPVVVRLAGEIRRITAWLDRAHALAAGAGMELQSVGQAGHGVLHVALDGVRSAAQLGDAVLAPLRGELAGEGGSAVLERAPAAIKAGLDVWGPVSPESLAIMSRIKREFDPAGLLNPGRFVGGL